MATSHRPPASGSTRSSRSTWILIGLLLAPAVVLPLLVPIYDRADPELFGFPFFYWFQFALIPLASAFTVAAYYLAKGADRRGREQRRLTREEGQR